MASRYAVRVSSVYYIKLVSQMAERVISIVGSLGVGQLYLQTESLQGGLYHQLGWKPCEQVDYQGCKVLVMKQAIQKAQVNYTC